MSPAKPFDDMKISSQSASENSNGLQVAPKVEADQPKIPTDVHHQVNQTSKLIMVPRCATCISKEPDHFRSQNFGK